MIVKTGNRIYFLLVVPLWLLLLNGCSTLQLSTDAGAAIVPPELEIEVLDPRTDPQGNPAVQLDTLSEFGMNVDVTPTVLVFKYYYSGNRNFRGPLLKGGPYTISTKHPKTGEPCYVPIQLPAGSPRVFYTNKSIRLDYGKRGVTITFGRKRPTVKYRNGPNLNYVLKQQADSAVVKKIKGTGDYVGGVTADGFAFTAAMGEQLLIPLENLVRVLPFVNWLPFWDPNYVPGAFAENYMADKQRENAVNQSYQDEATYPTIR